MVSMAEVISDKYTTALDMKHLSKLQCDLLHAIKNVAVSEWAREQLKKERGERK